MKIKIGVGAPKGEVYAPPSKSYAHRLLICSALSSGGSVDGISDSEDMGATLDCIKAFGVCFSKNGSTVTFENSRKLSADGSVLFCRESGSTMRFFIPIALALGGKVRFCGTDRLMSRGFSVYEDIFKAQGIDYKYEGNSLMLDGQLKSGEFLIRGDISSQFITGLMLALPLLDGDSVIRVTTELESRPYVDITVDALSRYGIEISETEPNVFYIKGSQKYQPQNMIVEGDYSNAAFLDAFNYVGGRVDVLGLNKESRQGDKVYKELFCQLQKKDPVLDISLCPDLGPVLFALAGVKNGAYITGTKRLRIKESDRAAAMGAELSKFGIITEIEENSVKITAPKKLKKPSEELWGHNDHRIVMALSVIATLTGAVIDGAEAVSKSYPDFFEVIGTLGTEVINEH